MVSLCYNMPSDGMHALLCNQVDLGCHDYYANKLCSLYILYNI